jgi:hypothetical protein
MSELKSKMSLCKIYLREIHKALAYCNRAPTSDAPSFHRRVVIPTMANLGTFLITLVYSIVLSFTQVDEHTKVNMLVLCLLFT